MGGYLLILTICAILAMLLGIPAMLCKLMRRIPARRRRIEIPPDEWHREWRAVLTAEEFQAAYEYEVRMDHRRRPPGS
jgi:hypothetical protein